MIDWDQIEEATRWELLTWVTDIGVLVQGKIGRIKMGTHDEQRDGNLIEVLEEIERILR